MVDVYFSIKQLLTFALHGHVALIDSLMEMPFNNYRPSFAPRQVLTKLMRTYITAYKQVDFASDKHTLFRVQLMSNIMYLYIGSLLQFSASGIKCLQPLFLTIRGMHCTPHIYSPAALWPPYVSCEACSPCLLQL